MSVTYTAGDLVRIVRDTGEAMPNSGYKVIEVMPNHIVLYGGDPDPKGRRCFRYVTADQLRPMTPKERSNYEAIYERS